MSLLLWSDDPETTWTPVEDLPTAFIPKGDKCARCRDGMPIMEHESAREYSERESFRRKGCPHKKANGDLGTALPKSEQPIPRRQSVRVSGDAPTAILAQVDQFARCAGLGCARTGGCACACPQPKSDGGSTCTP
jgi:hypothetical protein